MPLTPYVQSLPFFETDIVPATNYFETVEVRGRVRKHPYDDQRVIVLRHPFDQASEQSFLEIMLQDIIKVEELPVTVTSDGNSLPLLCLRVKKNSIALEFRALQLSRDLI